VNEASGYEDDDDLKEEKRGGIIQRVVTNPKTMGSPCPCILAHHPVLEYTSACPPFFGYYCTSI